MDGLERPRQEHQGRDRHLISHQRPPVHDKTLRITRPLPHSDVLGRQNHLRRVRELDQDSPFAHGYLLLPRV